MDIGRYLKVGLRWWWLIILSVMLSATASYFYSQRLPKIYAAKSSLLVGTSVIETLNPNERTLGVSRTLAEVYGEVAQRRIVTQAVIDKLGLDMHPDDLSEMMQTNVIPSAQLLEIFILDIHPQRAQLLANAIADELVLQSPTGSQEQQEREQFINTQIQELQTKISDTNQKIQALEESLGTMTSAVEIAEAQSQLNQLEILKGEYQNNYNQFVSNLSESAANQLSVFERATEPMAPVAPNIRNNVLIAAVAGLVLAISAIIVLEFLDDTLVWRGEETRRVFDLPVLGAINKVKNGKAKKIITGDELWSSEADALRSLRSNIFLAAPEQTLSTLLITSSVPNEGKSFISTNLAATIASPGSSLASVVALPGTKVVLVDADLRKPSLHEVFDMPNLLGLADVLATPSLSAEPILNKALRPTHIDNLLLLPAGRTPMDPGYLLNSPRFAEVLDTLKTQADLIIIDSAPLLNATETRFIANIVDGTFLTVNSGRTRRTVVQKAIDFFQNSQRNTLMGLVFNRVELMGGFEYYHSPKDGQRQQALMSQSQPSLFKKIWPFARNQEVQSDTLTLAETADYLGVSENVARRWCEEGRLQAVKRGLRWSVHLENLNEFITDYQNSDNGTKYNIEQDPAAKEEADLEWDTKLTELSK
jgi:capsular exopolysaccharide synthesis family protein